MLIQSLKLLHPFMPFITEEIFCNLQEEEQSIMISSWPVYKEEWNFAAEEHAVETIKESREGDPERAYLHERSAQQKGQGIRGF